MKWIVESVPELDGYTVEWADADGLVLSRRNVLYTAAAPQSVPQRLATIGAPFWKAAASRWRPFQRLLRFQVTNVVRMSDGECFVTFDRSAGVVIDGVYRELKGLVQPCRVLRGACAVDSDDNVYFGEYLLNFDRGPMRIYRVRPGSDTAETAHGFEAGEIRHVHGIYRDVYDESLVCLTGDWPAECRMLRTRDGFATMETIGEGDESWRAVSALFTSDAIFYGTDAEFRTNVVYRLDREAGTRTALGEVSGTVFYAKKVGDGLIFSTTAENAPSQTENVVALLAVDGDSLVEIAKFPKDMWHPTLFQFGTVQFPNGPGNGRELYFSLVGVKGDNRAFRVRPESV